MAALSDSAIWEPLFIAIGVSALFLGGFRARAFVICLVLSLLITTQVTGLLKSAVDRHRPKHVENVRMVQLQRTRPAFLTLFKKPTIRFSDSSDRNRSGPSFPSGHVTTNSVIAVFCTLFYRRWRLALLVRRLGRWLFANLSGCTLAKRRGRNVLSGRRRSTAPAGPVRIDLEERRPQMDAAAFCALSKFDF